MPVPRIVAEDDGFMAVEDAGVSLTKLCGTNFVTTAEKLKACRAARHALARLHSAGFAHGRPALRDMCWDGRQIRFIDFEYFVPAEAGWLRKFRDVGIALLSALCRRGDEVRYAYCILTEYYAARRRQLQVFRVLCPVRNRQSRIR
ncbi:hypothetical protein [uncultured Ruegeria sp.]|uniref:hypothetical protein n=1 Tax=uncultured Ruegeria sp. TaxID=259304 RepID=UPI002622EBF3|nr:hypothetical protein [uncultured Ruegeria sp.]